MSKIDRKIKAIIFDADGVIWDSETANFTILSLILKTLYDLTLTNKLYAEYFAGRRLSEAIGSFSRAIVNDVEINPDEIMKNKKKADDQWVKVISAYQDAKNLIEKARDKLRLALATGSRKNQVNLAIEKFELANTFEVIVTAEDCQKGKPDPEPYLFAAQKLNLSPNQILVIEDSPIGIRSAKDAGTTCLAVTHTFSEEELSEADVVVDDLIDFKVLVLLELS